MQTHKPKGRKVIFIFGFILLIAAIGIGMRIHAAHALRSETQDSAIPIVAVVKATNSIITEEIVLPGNVQAWHEAPIYARTNGYLKYWKTDIGSKVKAGDLLAEIEAPEIDSGLRQVEADVKTAEANNILAQTTAKRWKALLAKDSVSKQEADEKTGDAAAKSALLASAIANRDRLRDLASFKRVTAPFDGTITARNTDTGALINAGSGSTSGQELFHIADTTRLRIYIQVPQNYAGDIHLGAIAELNFVEHPGKHYTAKLIKTSDAIDPTNRSLLAEFATDNHNGELLAGGYTEAHLKLPEKENAIRLPVNTLIFRANGLQVAIVDIDNHAQLKTVSMGRDFGNEVEITTGIQPNDSIIVNPPDSLANGQTVRVSKPEETKNKSSAHKEENK
jgi:RND family efflux transporter MFP subunit